MKCFKVHREGSTCVETGHPEKPTKSLLSASDGIEYEDQTDKLTSTKLELLQESKQLREMLKNPHLRQIIETLDSSTNKEKLLSDLMREPIFLEFADECLECIGEGSP